MNTENNINYLEKYNNLVFNVWAVVIAFSLFVAIPAIIKINIERERVELAQEAEYEAILDCYYTLKQEIADVRRETYLTYGANYNELRTIVDNVYDIVAGEIFATAGGSSCP